MSIHSNISTIKLGWNGQIFKLILLFSISSFTFMSLRIFSFLVVASHLISFVYSFRMNNSLVELNWTRDLHARSCSEAGLRILDVVDDTDTPHIHRATIVTAAEAKVYLLSLFFSFFFFKVIWISFLAFIFHFFTIFFYTILLFFNK